ncbi:MAG: DUF5697 family protein [Oscillospiraceae bacterium]|nr:DUF5697 family protein [Oscillospiraceae bacterium]
MKTRDTKKAGDLLRTLAEYKTLRLEQALRLFPGPVISYLRRQGRICDRPEGRIAASEDVSPDPGAEKAVWLLLDFIGRVDYHAAGDFPVTLYFFLGEELYEVVYIPPGQETLICHAMAAHQASSKRICIIESTEQIEKIDFPGISGFCTVNEAGDIQYYQRN